MIMIVINLIKSCLNFVVLNIFMSLALSQDPKFYIGSGMAIIMGFMLRIVIEWNNNTITWKKSVIQAVMSLCLCYLCVLYWRDYAPNIKLEYYLFFCSLFSVFIVGLLEKTFKLGVSGYAKILLKKILAEDSKPKED